MSHAALNPMLNVAIVAARKAGSIINRASLDLERVQINTKGPNDFVTEVDKAAEDAIIETLLTAYPSHGILAEESGQTQGAKESEYVWIIDPLDGTTNFIHGFPVFAVSIALAVRGQVQQAVVYDPSRNDLFYASKGKGAYLNDRRLRVSKRIQLRDSLIGTGFPFRKGDNFQRYLHMFELIMSQCAGLRRPGAAALDLCYVAAGYYDGFFETGLSPWDIAAGSLMITEAGGLIGNFTGEADYLFQREIVAGTPRIYGQLVRLLTPFSQIENSAQATDAASAKAESATPLLTAGEDQSLPANQLPLIRPKLTKKVTADSSGDAHSTAQPLRAPVRIRRSSELPAADSEQPKPRSGFRQSERERPTRTSDRARGGQPMASGRVTSRRKPKES